MPIDIITPNITQQYRMANFQAGKREISYGQINMQRKAPNNTLTTKDKLMAGIGSAIGVAIPLAMYMKKQNTKNIFQVKYGLKEMLMMAAGGSIGGILVSSIGDKKEDMKKKWKEGAYQMALTTIPMLLIDSIIAFCEKSKNPKINNNLAKTAGSIAGVIIGTNASLEIFNRLRDGKEAKKPEREFKWVDMISNLDDAVAICVLAKIPFADKLHVERALPFIYGFCGYRSGTGEKRY